MSKWDRIEERLPEIKEWAREGHTEKNIIKMLGISPTTFTKYKKQYPQLRNTLNEGYEYSLPVIEASLYKIAKGYQYDEITKEYDSKENEMKIVKTVTKEVTPNVSAIMNILKNKLHDKWTTTDKIDIKGEITNKSFPDLPSELVSKLAYELLDKEETGDEDEEE